jgi:long-subunit fatty acid transport protein
LALGIEAALNERWSIVSEPFFEAYWFTGGLNSGRADQIYSVSLGLKYNITPNVSLVAMIAYEQRFSNVDDRQYRSLDIGPKLNFAF